MFPALQDWEERLYLSLCRYIQKESCFLPLEPHTTPFPLLSSALPIEIGISYWTVPSQGRKVDYSFRSTKKHDLIYLRPPQANNTAFNKSWICWGLCWPDAPPPVTSSYDHFNSQHKQRTQHKQHQYRQQHQQHQPPLRKERKVCAMSRMHVREERCDPPAITLTHGWRSGVYGLRWHSFA